MARDRRTALGRPPRRTGKLARIAVRQAVRDAWAECVEHTVELSVLAETGLADDAALAAVGWGPVLLVAIDRSQGWGRPSKASAVKYELPWVSTDVAPKCTPCAAELAFSRPAEHPGSAR
ncbi:hypothetical protein ACFVZA_40215 [Streptomyces bottropensis]|uniref:hypothetical protein n=1 Tax=Streptomyces bottropensis TaxID=42235 RepID=UPI00367E4469